MRRGTTPILKLNISGLSDLSVLKEMYVTIAQGSTKVTKETADITVDVENSQLKVSLTEKETLAFKPTPVFIQLRAVTEDGEAIATNMAQVTVSDVLFEEEITTEGD